jgi:predicted nucleic acid-binding protein
VRVFIDSNVPMYVAGRDHPNREPARRFLARVQTGEVEGCTSTEALQEILHRYSGMGRRDLAFEVYDLFLQMCPVVLPVTLADTDRCTRLLREIPQASVRDALHAAVMLNNKIAAVATFDADFDAIPGIERLKLS